MEVRGLRRCGSTPAAPNSNCAPAILPERSSGSSSSSGYATGSGAARGDGARVRARLQAPFYDALFTKLVVKVGADAKPLLEAAIARKVSRGNAFMRKLMVARMKKALSALKQRRR